MHLTCNPISPVLRRVDYGREGDRPSLSREPLVVEWARGMSSAGMRLRPADEPKQHNRTLLNDLIFITTELF